MVCNGVIPIDKIKDYLGPMDLLASRIPKEVFEKLYHIKIEKECPSGSEVLTTYAIHKGYWTGNALPDMAKSSKYILKDFVNGILLYCKIPPNYSGEKIW